MEAHLESCSECRAIFARYKGLQSCFQDTRPETVEAAGERVWKNLSAPELIFPRTPIQKERPAKKIWTRSVTLPLPAAAAAAVFVILVFLALLGLGRPQRSPAQDTFAAVMPENLQVLGDDHGMLQIQDMTGVLQYLSSQDYGDFMVIRLPETRKFSSLGEPALINAADYSRRISY